MHPYARRQHPPPRAADPYWSARARRILYDLTELENASRFKKGEDQTRTEKKVANVRKWFVKLDTDLGGFLTYFA